MNWKKEKNSDEALKANLIQRKLIKEKLQELGLNLSDISDEEPERKSSKTWKIFMIVISE